MSGSRGTGDLRLNGRTAWRTSSARFVAFRAMTLAGTLPHHRWAGRWSEQHGGPHGRGHSGNRVLSARRVVTNAELATIVPDADPDWVSRKTLIEARRFAAPDEATSDLAAKAARAGAASGPASRPPTSTT